MIVSLVFVMDKECEGDYHVWDVYSEYVSKEKIIADIKHAIAEGEFSEDTDYLIEEWTVNN